MIASMVDWTNRENHSLLFADILAKTEISSLLPVSFDQLHEYDAAD
jgi:hypothetical protein